VRKQKRGKREGILLRSKFWLFLLWLPWDAKKNPLTRAISLPCKVPYVPGYGPHQKTLPESGLVLKPAPSIYRDTTLIIVCIPAAA